MKMKALSPEFQPLLDQGQELKQRLSSGLSNQNKDSFRFKLKAWSNSVISQTQSIRPRYGTESLDSIFEFAEFYVEGLTPERVAIQIDLASDIIATIPAKEPPPPVEISVSLELQKLISLGRAATQAPRKSWECLVERLNEVKKTHAHTYEKDVPIEISQLIGDVIRDLEAVPDDPERRARNFAEEYERLKSAVDGRVSWIARMISKTTFFIISMLLIIGAIEVMLVHPIHSGILNVVLGVSVIVFVLTELLGVLHHLGSLRAKLESVILPKLRRFFGTEASPDEHISVLGLGPKS